MRSRPTGSASRRSFCHRRNQGSSISICPLNVGDRITALIPLGDTLIVFGQTRVYLVIGQTSLDFEVRPSAGAVDGALGPRACCVVEQGIVHAGASAS